MGAWLVLMDRAFDLPGARFALMDVAFDLPGAWRVLRSLSPGQAGGRRMGGTKAFDQGNAWRVHGTLACARVPDAPLSPTFTGVLRDLSDGGVKMLREFTFQRPPIRAGIWRNGSSAHPDGSGI